MRCRTIGNTIYVPAHQQFLQQRRMNEMWTRRDATQTRTPHAAHTECGKWNKLRSVSLDFGHKVSVSANFRRIVSPNKTTRRRQNTQSRPFFGENTIFDNNNNNNNHHRYADDDDDDVWQFNVKSPIWKYSNWSANEVHAFNFVTGLGSAKHSQIITSRSTENYFSQVPACEADHFEGIKFFVSRHELEQKWIKLPINRYFRRQWARIDNRTAEHTQ